MSTQELTSAADDQSETTWNELSDLPPSAKLVAKVLEYNGTLTQTELAERTQLPARTVRYALGRLEDHDAVESRFSFSDARKRLYTLTIADAE